MTDDLRIGQLLCTRLCHDLSGPIGALLAGLDMASEPERRDELMPLLTATGDDLMRRFAFFRLAFGLRGGDHGTATLREAQILTAGLTCGSRVRVDCRFAAGELERARPAAPVRLLLCLILVGIGAVPRGGVVRVDVPANGAGLLYDLVASGEGARLEPSIQAILVANPPPQAIDARTVHAALAVRLARALGVVVTVAPPGPGRIQLSVEPETTLAMRRRATI